jgi:hypothetical protein
MKGKEKAQVSAPIELFVAVIILMFTLALGFSVMKSTEEGKCIATLKTQTQNLKNAMLDVALGSAGTKRIVSFEFPRCGDKQIVGLQFVLYKDARYCRLCPGSYGYCWQVVPVAKDPNAPDKFIQVSDGISCVSLAGDIDLSEETGGACQGLSSTPCFGPGTCNSKDYGLVPSVWSSDPLTTKSIFNTLDGRNTRVYLINLTKSVDLSVGGARGQIQICAYKP